LAGQYPEERKKHRLYGMADELARPQKDPAAIAAAERYYESIKKKEANSKKSLTMAERIKEKERKVKLKFLSKRKLDKPDACN
jgi:hypothetical protein